MGASHHTNVSQVVRLNNVVFLKELLLSGSPTNGHNDQGWHPLHEAAESGHVECVRWLLVAGAEVDALTPDGRTALYLACKQGECYTEIVKLLLLAGADPNMKFPNNSDSYVSVNPLSNAAFTNNYDIVKLLLDAGGDPNIDDYECGTPLMVAAAFCNLKMARLLVERGAKADFENDGERTAIHSLLFPPRGTTEDCVYVPFIDLLVDGGLDVNAKMSDNSTPLKLAIEGMKVSAVLHLLELGADPNIDMEFGGSVLHEAIACFPDFSTDGPNFDHALKRILELTSRGVIPTKFESTIFHVAIGYDRLNSLELMVNESLPPDSFLMERTRFIRLKCPLSQVRIAIDLGIEVDTPLGCLLSNPLSEDRVKLAKFMIENGSDVNAVVPRCLPPLVAAVKHQRARYTHGSPSLDILEYLLNNGVDVMHKISATDILPAALHISSLFNVQAFFALLVRCIPVHEIYTPRTLELLHQLYDKSEYYKVCPLWLWRVISWLNVVNAFVPRLPLDTKYIFDNNPGVVEDDHLSSAWDDLNAQIGSPKKLEHLSILTIRRVVGECRGWDQLTKFLPKLTLMNEPLPDIIMDLLTFKQMESSCLSKWPPHEVMSRYVLSAGNSWADYRRNANRDNADDLADEAADDDANDEYICAIINGEGY